MSVSYTHLKAQGYKYSTLSAISVAVCDAVIPPQKQELIAEADQQIAKVGKLFNRGLISDNERYNQTIDVYKRQGSDHGVHSGRR